MNKSPRLSLGARLRLFPVILNPVCSYLQSFRLPKRPEAQSYISIIILGDAMHKVSIACLVTLLMSLDGEPVMIVK